MSKRDRKQLANRIAVFVRQYGRKADSSFDPNDRAYDRRIEALIRKMSAEELDKLLRESED